MSWSLELELESGVSNLSWSLELELESGVSNLSWSFELELESGVTRTHGNAIMACKGQAISPSPTWMHEYAGRKLVLRSLP